MPFFEIDLNFFKFVIYAGVMLWIARKVYRINKANYLEMVRRHEEHCRAQRLRGLRGEDK
jgi:hypothetical protein